MTAGPLLRLLLAMEETEPPRLRQNAAWSAFRRFANVPVAPDSADAGCTLQTEVHDEADYPVLVLRFARQIGRMVESEAGTREDVRLVGCEFFMPLPVPADGLESREIWSDELDSLDAFLAHVEGLPEFAYWLTAPQDVADLLVADAGAAPA